MLKIIDTISALLSRRKPVTREEAAEIADWVGEGGAPDPDGPPRVVDRAYDEAREDREEARPGPQGRRHSGT